MPTLLHLNGPSGVGKSTLARLHAERHPGTLVCDIDDLRSWVSGWAATPVTAVISRIIEERGGDALVLEGRQQLLDLASEDGWTVVDATDRDAALDEVAGIGRD